MSDLASMKYAVTTRRTPLYRRALSWAMTLFQALGGEGTAPVWRNEAIVTDMRTNRELRVIRNRVGACVDDVHQVTVDVDALTTAEFESLWLA